MTTTPSPSITVYSPTGTTTGPFATGWTYAAPEDVWVYIETDGVAGPDLIDGTDYGLTATNPAANGGSVTLTSPAVPVGGWTEAHQLIVRRWTARRQSTALPDVEGHKPRATEQALDRAMRIAEEQQDELDLSVKVGPGETPPTPAQIAAAATAGADAAEAKAAAEQAAADANYAEASADNAAFDAAAAQASADAAQVAVGNKADRDTAAYQIGLFADAAGAMPPLAVRAMQTSAYGTGASTQPYSGAAKYLQDAAVDATFVALWPRASFIDGDGNGWRLDVTEGTPEMFGAKGDGTTNDSVAVRQAIFWCGARNIPLRLLGSYYVNEQIDYTGSLALIGVVPQVSNLIFGASGNLILRIPDALEYGGAFLSIKDIGLFAKTLNTGAGLRVYGAEDAAGSTHRTIDMENVDISGVDGLSSFRDGVWIKDGRNSSFRSVRIQGDRATPPPWQALTGFNLSGEFSSTEMSFKECRVFFTVKAVQGRGNIEGVRFHDCVFVAVYDGIDADMSASFSGAGAGVPLWCFDYGHLNVIRTMVKFRGISQFSISGNELYVTAASGDFIGLDLDINVPAEAASQIFGNAFLRQDLPAMNPGATYTAIRLNSTVGVGTYLVDVNNILPNWDVGVHLMPDCTQALIGQSNRITAPIPILNEGAGNSVFDALPVYGLPANDSTPKVEQFYTTFFSQNTSARTITRFDNLESGKRFVVIVKDNFTTFQHNANLLLARGKNFTAPLGTVLWFVQDGGVTREVSRSNGVNIFRNIISPEDRVMIASSGTETTLGYDPASGTASSNVILGPNLLPKTGGQGQIGDASQRFDVMAADKGDFTEHVLGGGIRIFTGSGDPSAISAPDGSFYIRTVGGGWYQKQPGGWVVK